jgi:hypothetical protein
MVKRGVKALREKSFILTDVDRAGDIEEFKTITDFEFAIYGGSAR